MRIVSRVAIVALLVVPGVLTAQRGGMGGMGRGGMGRGGGGRGERGSDRPAAPQVPSSDDILKDSPLRLLIDKKKELSLSDSQRTNLVFQQGQLDQRLQHLLVELDSARANRPRVVSDSAVAVGGEQRDAAINGFRAVRMTLNAIRAAEDSAAVVAVNGLGAKQRSRAYKLLADRREAIDKREAPPRGRQIGPPQIGVRAPE